MNMAPFAPLLIAVAVVGVGVLSTQETLREDMMLSLTQAPEPAYALAEKHFDAAHAELYNIDRAAELYREVLRRDPSFPYAHHQLARIAFLKGDFTTALERITIEINRPNGPASPSSYYIRALIEGFAGKYAASAEDYRRYLQHDPSNWAATNDLAWVLLKDARWEDTIAAIDPVLRLWPTNPWLLNSKAIALYELGRYEEALNAALQAHEHLDQVTNEVWSMAYPGNDPLIAPEGVATFRTAVIENMHRITIAYEKSYESVR